MGIVEVVEIVGLGLVAAANPLPVIGQLALVTRPGGRGASVAFAAGWAGALLVATGLLAVGAAAVVAALFGGSGDPGGEPYATSEPGSGTDGLAPWVPLLIGIVLLVLGVLVWFTKPPAADAPPSRLATAFETLGPGKAVLLGAGLALVKPKTIAAVIGAAAIVGADGLAFWPSALLVVLFTVAGSVAVGLPVVLAAVGGDRVSGVLASMQAALSRNKARITGGLLFVVGAIILVVGLTSWLGAL